MRPIPLVDVKAQYEPLLPRIREAIDGVLASAEFILGPNVAAFEREAAAYLGAREAVGVANGTDALVLVLDALGIGPGDEVVCPAFTFYATAEAVARRGATPVCATPSAPKACAASSTIGTSSPASSGSGAGRPKRWTGMIAFVLGVIRRETSCTSRFSVTASMSAKTGVAPRRTIASGVA